MHIIQANKFYYLRGGAERYMLDISAWLESLGHRVIPFAMAHTENLPTVYARYFPEEVETGRVSLGISAVHTFARMLYSFSARRKLATLIVEQRPDIAHLHNIYTQLSPSILHTLKDRQIPTIMTVHDHHLISPEYNVWADGCGPDRRRVGIIEGALSRFHKQSFAASFAQVFAYKFHRSLNIYARNVEVFLCPSKYIKQQLILGGFPEEKLRVLPHGIDVSEITPSYTHKKYALFVGRLSAEKGIETIISLAKVLPDITFKIVGRGPEMEALHRAGDKCPNLEFLGFRMGEELAELYRQATVVLLPSRVHEVFPLTVLEAMAYGKPVIGSRVGGMGEIIEDRVNGFLVGPRDIQGWTEALARVFYDEEFYRSLSRQARFTVETRFTIAQHRRALLQIYEQYAKKNTAR